eukprot:Awhi_evm1s7841
MGLIFKLDFNQLEVVVCDYDTERSCATSAIALEGNCLDVTSIKSCTSDTENIECEICAIGYEKDILTSTCNDCAMGYYVSEDGCSSKL